MASSQLSTQPGPSSTRGELRLVSVGADPGPVWETFVEDHPHATVFHTPAWLKAVSEVFQYRPEHRLVYDEGGDEPIAAAPGFAVSEPFGDTVVNPFCEYGFPLLGERAQDGNVLSALASIPGRFDALVLKDVEWTGIGGYSEAAYGGVVTGTSRRLALDRPPAELRESTFKGDARRNIRIAEDHGVTVEEGTIEGFYDLYLATMQRLGSPQFPIQFFQTLANELGEAMTVFVAWADGTPIGAHVLFEWGGETITWSNGSNADYWDYRPNHLLDWATIERAYEQGHSVVDFGRSRPGSGVDAYKSQFGADAYQLASMVTPPHRAGRASLEGYQQLAPLTERLAPFITHPAVGPKLKRVIHE